MWFDETNLPPLRQIKPMTEIQEARGMAFLSPVFGTADRPYIHMTPKQLGIYADDLKKSVAEAVARGDLANVEMHGAMLDQVLEEIAKRGPADS